MVDSYQKRSRNPILSARESPGLFMAMTSNGRYTVPYHLEVLNSYLKKVARGAIKRLIITMPPRHGKTLFTSIYFPVWWLCHNPDKKLILASYGSGLAYDPAKLAHDVFEEWAPIVFDLKIDPARGAAMDWSIEGYLGGMYSVGRRGALTGKGASLFIIDDPIKDAQEAQNEHIRQGIWEWYTQVASTRLEPKGAIILILCMTGDTPVLMADGTERQMREIKVGDQVATYDNGLLGVSTVRGCRRNHPDNIYRIKTNKGTTVRANERHPFLVEENGVLQWIQLRDLKLGHRIVTVKDSGESGKETLVGRGLWKAQTPNSNTDMGSPPPSMTRYLRRKAADVPSAGSHRGTIPPRIGPESYASITTTKTIRSGGFYATPVISPLDTPEQKRMPPPSWNTSDFTTEEIVSIEPAGIEEVYDLQIEYTENFIANGLVSHNTRWHEDDLAGRLLFAADTGGEKWDLLNMPAIAEEAESFTLIDERSGEKGVRKRKAGQPLWPDRFDLQALAATRKRIGEYAWAALYQQHPTPMAGGFFKEQWIQYFDPHTIPDMDMIIQSWDTAQTKSTTSDFVVGQVWGRRGADFYLLDQVRDRWDFDETVAAMKLVTKTWPESSSVIVEAQTLGAALAGHLKKQISGIIPIHVKQSKELRAMSCVPAWQSLNVFIPHPDKRPWVREYIRELLNFPMATNDDQVDATTLALNQLRGALFPHMHADATKKKIEKKNAIHDHEYVMGWVPARLDDEYTVVVYDLKDNAVVRFFRIPAQPIEQQITAIFHTSAMFNSAICRVIEGYDDALTYGAELKGVYIEKIKFNKASIAAAYENLSQLIRNKLIDVPEYPELMAELNVFRSEDTFDETPDYTTQIGQQSAINALALCTYDLDPTMWDYKPDVYANFEFDIV